MKPICCYPFSNPTARITATKLIWSAIQTLGGVGIYRDFPEEQYARDVKVISVWEGTFYIQSLDLVGRELGWGILDFAGANKEDDETQRGDWTFCEAVNFGKYSMEALS